MTRSINIVIGNHAGYRGIEDYVHYLEFTFKCLGCSVSNSITPRKDVDANMWIEEFSGLHVRNFSIEHSGATPPNFVICTEYPSRYQSFNVFSLPDRIFALIRFFFPTRFIVRNIFVSTSQLSKRLAISLVLPLMMFGYLIGFSKQELFYRLQLTARFINLKKLDNQIAGFIVINETFKSYYEEHFPSIPVYILTPLLPDFPVPVVQNVNFLYFFSGYSKTYFRRRWFQKVIAAQNKDQPIFMLARYALRNNKASFHTDLIKVIAGVSQMENRSVFLGSFSSENDLPEVIIDNDQATQHILCEVYVGQTRNWPFASPMRDYRALRNGHISISAGCYLGTIFQDLVITAPKGPHDFIKFIRTFDVGQFIESIPHHIESHNSRHLPLNQAIVEFILPTPTTSEPL